MNQLTFTIKNLADSARRRGIEDLGEAAFARLCMDFEKALESNSLNAVIQLMAEVQNPKTIQLGCCWLDIHGYGDRSVEWLGAMLVKTRGDID